MTNGRSLVVTDKTSNTIETLDLDDGELQGPFTHASSGTEPFGFAFAHRDVAVVSEAFGGAPGKSAVSSYQVDDDGALRLITASLGTTQTAACWVVVTQDGKFAYTANAGSSTISGIAVSRDGSLTLANAVAGHTPARTSPTDLALSQGSRFLYALASGTISAFRVAADGSLAPVGTVSGLPSSTVGLAAR